MSEARGQYQAFACKPASGSDYEFFLEAMGILERAPFLEQICRAIRNVGGVSQWGSFEALREHVKSQYRTDAVNRLVAGGMPLERVVGRDDSTTSLIDSLVDAQMSTLFEIYANAVWTRHLQHRVPVRYRVLRAAMTSAGSGPKAAMMLNQNSSRSAQKLTKDHIRRGCQAYLRHLQTWIGGVTTPGGAACLLSSAVYVDQAFFLVLSQIRHRAKSRSELKALKGKDLALTVDEKFGLARIVLKRASEMDASRQQPLQTMCSIAALEMATLYPRSDLWLAA